MSRLCPCSIREIEAARDMNELEWTKRIPHEVNRWKRFAAKDPLWTAKQAKKVLETVLKARRRNPPDIGAEARALRVISVKSVESGWGARKKGEAAANYLGRMVAKTLTRLMRRAAPKSAPKTTRAKDARFAKKLSRGPVAMGDWVARLHRDRDAR